MADAGVFEDYQRSIVELGKVEAAERQSAIARLFALESEMSSRTEISDFERWYLTFMLSSAVINLSSDLGDLEGLSRGIDWATRLIVSENVPVFLVPQAAYNRANGLLASFQISETADQDSAVLTSNPRYRLDHPDGLQEARALFRVVGHDLRAPADVRSRALCNLGNVLDESGRWVEAYAAYSDALAADPTNGNAAGNLAELLRRRLISRVEQPGHLAAVYDSYLTIAKSLRRRTIEVAGVATADRWDALELHESQGHVSHGGDELDDYQRWIVRHRLALVGAVEGLGSDSPQWDTASVLGVVRSSSGSVPGIFAALNVLKAEFIVTRRIAFRGQQMVTALVSRQHPDDTGLYTDTLDGALYGEGPALLLLAQRSALDVLDKIAVSANEHFQTALKPSRVDYATYWRSTAADGLKAALKPNHVGLRALLALSELASDLTERGIYPIARLLRNAGTHRLVHATEAEPTGPTGETFSTVNLEDLQSAALEALWVARAAYLYFVDLIDSQLSDPQDEDLIEPLPNQT